MDIKQVKGVVGAAINQLIGAGYYPVQIGDYSGATTDTDGGITGIQPAAGPLTPQQIDALDITNLNDLGEAISANPAARDIVFDTFCDRIGKIVVDARKFTAEIPDVFYDEREWGGMLEWVNFGGLAPILDDEMWLTMEKGGFQNYQDTDAGTPTGMYYGQRLAGMEHGFYKPRTQAKLFKKGKAFMIALSRAKDQLFSCCISWDEADKFLTGLASVMDRTLTVRTKVMAHTLIMGGIAKAIGLGHTINLVQIAHDMYDTNITTPAAFLADRRAQEFALQEVQNTLDQMKEFSAAYNDAELPNFATTDDLKLILISKYQNLLKYTVKADTFNADMLGLSVKPQRLTAWQAQIDSNGNAFTWDACTGIYLDANTVSDYGLTANADPETPGGTDYTTFKSQGIVGFAYSKMGCCMALEKQKATTSYTAVTDHINTFEHYLAQSVVNPAYPMVVFLLANAS